MQRVIICLMLTLVLAACNFSPAPQPTADIAATSQVMSATMVAATLTASLLNQTVSATETPSATETSSATKTLPPTAILSTETPTPTATLEITLTPEFTLTSTPKPASGAKYTGCFTPTGVSKQIAPFKIENMSKNKISVFINGMTRKGEHPIYCSYTLSKGAEVLFTIWWGDYTYLVQVNGKTSYDGSFWVNNDDKATMRITQTGVQLGPFP